MNDNDIRVLWLYVAETWPTFAIPTEPELVGIKTQAWQDQLGDLTQQQVRAAIVALGGSEFTPPLGKIRQKAIDLERQADGSTPPPDMDEAWHEAITTFGRDPNSHPAVHAAVKAIGENNLRYDENQAALRAHFFRIYESVKARYEREALLPAPAVLSFVGSGSVIKRVDDVLGIARCDD